MLKNKPRLNYKNIFLPLAILLIGLTITAGLAWHFNYLEKQEDQVRFQRLITKAQLNIKRNVDNIENALLGGRGLYAASKSVERGEWKAFVESLNIKKNYPSILALGSVAYLKENEIDEFLNATRADQAPNFNIKTFHRSNEDNAQLKEHAIIFFIEPLDNNKMAEGVDIASEPRRKLAADLARDKGEVAMTQPIELVQAKGKPGFLIFLPVYQKQAILDSVEDRRRALQFWIYAAFTAESLFNNIPEINANVLDMEVYWGTQPSSQNKIFDSEVDDDKAAFRERNINTTIEMIASQPFCFVWNKGVSFEAEGDLLKLSIFIVGAFISLLLSGLIYSLQRMKIIAEDIALEKTKDLQNELDVKIRMQADLIIKEQAIEASTCGIILTNPNLPDNPIVYVNSGFEKITGYGREEAIGKNCRFLQKNKSQLGISEIHRALEEKRSCQVTLENVRKDGSVFWNKLFITPVFSEKNELTHFLGIQTDVTQQKLNEASLQKKAQDLEAAQLAMLNILEDVTEEKNKNRLVLNSIGEGIIGLDGYGRIKFLNPAAIKILGWEEKELIGQYIQDFLVKAKDVVDMPLLSPLRTAMPRVLENEIFQTKSGQGIYVRLVSTPIIDEGSVVGVVIAFQDISGQVLMQRRLEESLKQVENIEGAIDEHAIVSIADVSGKIIYVNEKFCKLSGYSNEELLGKNHNVVNSGYHSKEFWKNFWDTIKAGRIWRAEIKNKAKDGSYYWVDSTVVPFLDDKGKPKQFISIRTDITSQKEIEFTLKKMLEDLNKAKQEAEAASKAKSEFVANMSHEIRTPMNAILGFSDLMMRTNLDNKQKEFLSTISSSGKMLIDIINDILDYSKLEAGKVDLEKIDFDMERLIYDVFCIIKPKIKSGINTYIDYPQDAPRWVKSDPTRIRQIVLNLLSNAVKFTAKGEIGIAVRVVKDQENKFIEVAVKDSGIGISKNSQEKIFEAFTQADSSTTRKYGGTGLGLTICRSLVAMMGGKIWVESKQSEGSQFIFTIPCVLGKTPQEKEIFPLSNKELKGKRVIIVDDNKNSREILQKYCDDCGFEVVGCFGSGEEAMKKIRECKNNHQKLDCILSDIMMPEMDGYEFVKKVKTNMNGVSPKVIAVTSDVRIGSAQEASTSGFDGFITKPIIRQELINVMATVLGDRRSMNQEIITKHTADEMACKGVRVLVVEDSMANQELLKAYFSILGCIADYSSNGKEALALLKNNQYEICLMDLQMSEMGGIEATQIIRREIAKDLPIIALTAAAMKEDREKALSSGMNDFLTKPVSMNSLRDKILQYARKQSQVN